MARVNGNHEWQQGVDSESCVGTSETFHDPEQLLAGILAVPTLGIAVVDEQMRYRAVNNALATIHRVPVEAHLGLTLHDVIGDVAKKIEPALEHVLLTGQPITNFKVSARLPSRAEAGHWIHTFFPLKDSHGRVKRVVLAVVEATREENPQEHVPNVGSSGCVRPAAWAADLEQSSRLPGTTDILRSWKEIAAYLTASVRTVQRWEKEYELPLRRLQKGKGASVFALRTELEDWLRGNGHRNLKAS